jgi:hypothetical protein
MGFARAWGAGGIVVVNLFAFRSTNPGALRTHRDDVIGPDNDGHLCGSTEGRRVIAAWGVHGRLYNRDRHVLQLLAGRSVECLGTTKDGHPKHPLYVPASMQPVPFAAPRPSPAVDAAKTGGTR